MRYARLLVVALAIQFWVADDLQAQESGAADLINLFFDCQAPGCGDLDFFRREIPFVNWVSQREAADVHLLISSQQTGGGGRRYTLAFLGVDGLEGRDGEVTHLSAGDATTDEQRVGLAEKTKIGLVAYVQETSVADRIRVVFEDPTGEGGAADGSRVTAEDDPWDFWVFRVGGNAFLNGQATSSFSNMFGNVEASRTTEAWKLSIGGDYSRNEQRFKISDDDGEVREVEEIRRDWGADGLVVRSIGERWALGVRASMGSSTFVNQDRRWAVKPGIELNLFPYSESSRRSLTFQYLVGPNHFNYTTPTIFGKTSETRLQQSLTGRLSLVEPWGRWSTSMTGDQFLHDSSKYSVTLSGNFNIRLFRGFSIRMSGNYSWIRDQLFLSSAGATEEQILLQQLQLETSYRYFTSFGIEYRFGSIFNNVVNPRFGGSGGGGIFF